MVFTHNPCGAPPSVDCLLEDFTQFLPFVRCTNTCMHVVGSKTSLFLDGTTAAAMHVLEEGGFRALIEDAVQAAAQRSRDLGEKAAE